MDKVSEAKHVLRRRSKLDSLIEIEKFNSNTSDPNAAAAAEKNSTTGSATPQHTTTSTTTTSAPSCSTNTGANKSADHATTDESITSLKWNDSRNTTADDNLVYAEHNTNTSTTEAIHHNTSTTTTQATHTCNHPEPQELSLDSAINMVLEQCPLETILEKYFANENSPQLKSSHIVAKFLSNAMETHSKIKTNVLETLSENHSKDFLDHAVQENLSSVVCDRLNLNSVIDYICAKSKINSGCRNNLLQQLPDILKHSKNDVERFELVKNLLQQCQFTDEHILDLINVLMQVRSGRTMGDHATMVSESAVDSSSNL